MMDIMVESRSQLHVTRASFVGVSYSAAAYIPSSVNTHKQTLREIFGDFKPYS